MSRLSLAILGALIAGLVAGTVIAGSTAGDTAHALAAPLGKFWLDALTMTVVPLVFSLLVTGIMSAAAEASGGRVATRALLWFALLLVAVSVVGGLVAELVLGVAPVPAAASALQATGGGGPAVPATLPWLDSITPVNPVRAAADSAMIPLVGFALLFGLAASRIEDPLRASLAQLFEAVAQTMLRIVHWILVVAPIGVFALAFDVGLRMGAGVAGVLAHYVAVVIVTILLTTALAYVAATVFGRIGIVHFARAALPPQIIAISTQSSLASLPAMIEAAPALDVARADAGVVLPLAVSLFRAASAAANVAVVLYLAALHGVPVGIGSFAAGTVIAAIVSVAAVGLPAQVSFFAIIAPVCLVMGVPVVLLPLLLAIETIPDLFRTLGNVTWDLAVTRIAAR
ncbi:MAG TPA: cation:dicarboxylase symporter family transporter [Sphingomonas sp.]|nr:cation:dicarboxylase symporter family transporter [Sphingomonas sp.]